LHIGSFTCLPWASRWSCAQAVSTVSRAGVAQIGAGWSFASADYSPIQGLSICGTFDFARHWGIEGDIHRVSTITPADIGEDSYLLGPRYVFRHNRFSPYAKVLFGLGRFKYQYDTAPHTAYTYKIYSFGGGLDIQATQHINVRAIDFEYRQWPGYPPNGLAPQVWTFGAAYAFR
jgi:hypothetical protein